MPKEPPRILAVNPGSRYIGYAAFRGPELLDWGVRVIRSQTPRGKLRAAGAILVEAVDRYHPEILAIKRLHRSRSSPNLNNLTNWIKQLSHRRKLEVYQYSISQVKSAFSPDAPHNKRRIAEQVAAAYPALTPVLQRELAGRNPYHLRMFEAVALGIVCYRQLPR